MSDNGLIMFIRWAVQGIFRNSTHSLSDVAKRLNSPEPKNNFVELHYLSVYLYNDALSTSCVPLRYVTLPWFM